MIFVTGLCRRTVEQPMCQDSEDEMPRNSRKKPSAGAPAASRKQPLRQLLDAKKGTSTKPVSSDPIRDDRMGARIVWQAGKTERKLKQILFHGLNAF